MAQINVAGMSWSASSPAGSGRRILTVIARDPAVRKAFVTGVGLVGIAATNAVLDDPAVHEPFKKALGKVAATAKFVEMVVNQLVAT